MPVRFKNRHVCADLRKDKQRGQFRDTRDCRDTPDLAVILAASEKKFCFDLSNGSIDEIHMGFGMGHLELLLFQDVVSMDSVHNLVFGSLNPAVNGCDSRLVRYTCEKLAEIKGISFEECARITTENGKRFFRIP